jgi:hypothetical protein
MSIIIQATIAHEFSLVEIAIFIKFQKEYLSLCKSCLDAHGPFISIAVIVAISVKVRVFSRFGMQYNHMV